MGLPPSGTRDARSTEASVETLCREIVEHSPLVFYVSEENGRVLYLSPAFEAMSGYPLSLVRENPMAWVDFIHPEDRERVSRIIRGSRGQGGYEVEYRVRRADGSLRWLSARGTEVRGASGQVERIVG